MSSLVLTAGQIISSDGLCWSANSTAGLLTLQTCSAADPTQAFTAVPDSIAPTATSTAAAAGAATTAAPAPGYRITTQGGYCVAYPAASPVIGAVMEVEPCSTSATNQLFSRVSTASPNMSGFQSGSTQLCIDVTGDNLHLPGQTMALFTCYPKPNQQFTLPSASQLPGTAPAATATVTAIPPEDLLPPTLSADTTVNATTQILTSDVPPLCWEASADGNYINANTCDSTSDAQTWFMVLGQLMSVSTGKCADLAGGQTTDGLRLGLYDCGGHSNQLMMPQANGSILAGCSYKCIGVSNPQRRDHKGPAQLEQRTCVSKAPGHIFTASNPPALFPLAPSTPCSSYSVRREWRDLSMPDRQKFINALEGVRRLPSLLGRRSFYDDIVAMHAMAIAYIHGSPQFLPWHRTFLALYEKAIQTVDPTVSIPFWDWGFDANAPLNDTDIFGSSNMSFGTRGNPSNPTPCVHDGFPRNWTSYDGSCLSRNYSTGFTLTDDTVLAPLVSASPNFTSFSGPLEIAHNAVHFFTGGMDADLYFIDLSANDPLFFMLHANVDRYWTLWQELHPQNAAQYVGTAQLPPGSGPKFNVSAADIMPGFNLPVSMALGSQGGDFCVKYVPYSGSKSSVVRRRRDGAEGMLDRRANGAERGGIRLLKSPGGARIGSGRFGTVRRRPPGDLPMEWVADAHRRLLEVAPGVHAVPAGDGMEEMLKRVREGEAMLKAIGDQFDEALDRHFEQSPTDGYEEAFREVVRGWEWRG
ncbi:hypothetical protein HK101_007331 [Irineochytrium annulatum]|nr:hypothetical protein HK101_007331 [Irineochytrium annulatum]